MSPKPRKPTPSAHREEIIRLRMEGRSAKQIAQVLGLNWRSVEQYASTHNLPRMMRDKRTHARIPFGKFAIANLTHHEIAALDRIAANIGAADLAEAALYVIRQATQEAAE
jgi:predicted transcriptional regulator